MSKLFPKDTIVKIPHYFFEHNRHLKFECQFCDSVLDFENKDFFAYRTMYQSIGSTEKWICKECFEKLNAKYKWNVEEYDWRINGNESYLIGKKLKTIDVLKYYTAKWNEWDGKDAKELDDHDHCCFCYETFMIDTANKNPFAYSSDDYKYWICEKCYNDFKEKFKWKLAK